MSAAAIAGWRFAAVASVAVAAYAVLASTVLPLGGFVHPDMRAAYEARPVAIRIHMIASALALALGPLQFSARLRHARPALHRWAGRAYLVLGIVPGALAGLFMSAFSHGGPVSNAGFALLALAWLGTAAKAYAAIRAGDVAAHRLWMLRNFALAIQAPCTNSNGRAGLALRQMKCRPLCGSGASGLSAA